eukprot:6619173-Prymnesium_polylepis.1
MSAGEMEATRASLLEQLARWQDDRDKARAQLYAQNAPTGEQPQPPAPPQPGKSGMSIGRKLSFGKKDKKQPAAPEPSAPPQAQPPPAQQPAPSEGEGNQIVRKSSFGKSSTLTRVLSFGKSSKKKEEGTAEPSGERKGSTAGNLVRKLSFGKKK